MIPQLNVVVSKYLHICVVSSNAKEILSYMGLLSVYHFTPFYRSKNAKMVQMSQMMLVLIVLFIHAATPQIHYRRFPSFYTFHQYPILNGYFSAGKGSGFYHRYVD